MYMFTGFFWALIIVLKARIDIIHILMFQVIFGKSSCPEFCKEAYTTVCYHNR